MVNVKTELIAGILRSDVENNLVLKVLNEYLESEGENPVLLMDEDFDDFCERNLTYTEVANAVHDGDFHPWHDYFRYDGSEFTSGDDIDSVYDYTEDDEFVRYICGGDVDLDELGITTDGLIDDFCDYFGYDKDKLVNHPNWEEHYITDEDWEDILDLLDIEEEEILPDEEED